MSQEHTAIIIMSSSAATCALATEILAAQRLWNPSYPGPVASVFVIFSSQMLGYGIAGLMRESLINSAKMVYPVNLPMNTLIETLHRDRQETKKKLNFFWAIFAIIFVWEVFPEYIMPVLTGISVFCLEKRDSLVVTNIFGGSNGNEGIGFLSFSLDWNYIGSGCLWLPPQTLFNSFIGYFLCVFCFIGLYYGNIWHAQDFPFLSSLMFSQNSTSTEFAIFNQSMILNADSVLVPQKVQEVGVPWFSPSYVLAILSNNLAVAATITHMILWNWDTVKTAFGVYSLGRTQKILDPRTWNWRFWQQKKFNENRAIEIPAHYDPHYRLMQAYTDVPNWWYSLVLIISFAVGLVCIYQVNSTLPWWGYIITCLLAYIFILFTGALYGVTGFLLQIQSLVQMIGGYLHPGMPLANMYFTCFGYNSVHQGLYLLKDLKLAQYAHSSPKCTSTAQLAGTFVGSVLNYVMMASITKNQRDILLSIQGTNIWSGQVTQSWNSQVRHQLPLPSSLLQLVFNGLQTIAWGALAKDMFSIGARYQWVSLAVLVRFLLPIPFYLLHRQFPKCGFNHINTAVLSWYLGYCAVGINSAIPIYFVIAFVMQFYVRRYKPNWFLKYNYLLSAALDGGTQVIIFILSFAVFGSSGRPVPFPAYWGIKYMSGNFDYCMWNPANGPY